MIEFATVPESTPNLYHFTISSKEHGLIGQAIAQLKTRRWQRWVVESIKIEPGLRGNGYGSQLLEYVCEQLTAMQPNVPISLNPAAPGFMSSDEFRTRMESGDFKVLQEAVDVLMEWYQRHGFSGDQVTMIRASNSLKAQEAIAHSQ